MGSAGGRFAALDSSLRRFFFCSADRPSCIGCSVRALRYAVAKSEKPCGVCGIPGMRLNWGKSNAVVVFCVSLFGNELAVIRTLLNGCQYPIYISTFCIRALLTELGKPTHIETNTASANHAFQPFDKIPRLAFLLLNVARPVLLPGAEDDLLRIRSHCI